MDTVYKVIEDCEVKKIGERQYEFTASTADIDRDGDVIDVEGWDLKNFKKNPIIMYAHDYRTLPIGKATHIGVKDGKLKNTVEFPPEGTYEFADIVERLVGTGYLKTESVGFIPRKWEDGDGEKNSPRKTYTKQELLEISIVPVPSNPNALINAVKAGVITTKQLEAITKPEETGDYFRIPVDTGDHEGHRIRTIDISEKEGIKAVYCGTDKVIMTYLFSKDEKYCWTMAKARAWVKEHEKSVMISTTTNSENDDEIIHATIQTEDIILNSPRAAKTSQEAIIDEIDYLVIMIDKEGLSDKAAESLKELIQRCPADDIAVEIEPVVLITDNTADTHIPVFTNLDILESIKRISR